MMMKRAVTVLMKNKSANKICNINNIFHPNMILSSCLPPISMQKDIIYVLFMPFDHATIINFDYDFVFKWQSYKKKLVFGAKMYNAFRGKSSFSALKQLTNPTKKCDACFRIY